MGPKAYFYSAAVVASISYGAYYSYKHIGLPNWWWEARLPKDVEVLDVADTETLKRVLYGGEPWLVQCYSGLPYAGQHLPAPFRMHPVFEESLSSLGGDVSFGVVDCEKPLRSNQSLASKLKLTRRTQPLLLFAVGGGRPKQLSAKQVDSAYAVTAYVKPKAEPSVRRVSKQEQLASLCGGRRACLLARMDADSFVLEQLARQFRTLEVVALGEPERTDVKWGRGEEVGETLEEEEAAHLAASVFMVKASASPGPAARLARPVARLASAPRSLLACHLSAPLASPQADPEAIALAGKNKQQRMAAPRFLSGFAGDADLPSLSRFVRRTLKEEADEAAMRTPLPTIKAIKPAKPTKAAAENDNRERQARRAKKNAEARAREEEEAAAQRAEVEKLSVEQREALRAQREAQRRRQMAEEEAAAGNLVEEVDEEEDDEEDDGGADYEVSADEDEDDDDTPIDLDD
jgi:hypothetical protein